VGSIGAGISVEASAFWNHAIIVGYYDVHLGFMLATPSLEAARFSGNPNLYYSKYSWSQLDVSLFVTSAQNYWRRLGWRECNWKPDGSCDLPPAAHKKWNQLSNYEQRQAEVLGYSKKTWNSPVAIHGHYYDDPIEYFAQYDWRDMLDFEMELFICLGWNKNMWESAYGYPATWENTWNNLNLEMRICATTIGYDKAKWNPKWIEPNPGSGLKQVSVAFDSKGVETVWGVNSRDQIYRKRGNSNWTEPNPGSGLKQVSVAFDSKGVETVWGVNSRDRIYRWSLAKMKHAIYSQG